MKLNINPIMEIPGAGIPFDFTIDLCDVLHAGEKPFKAPVRVEGKVENRSGMLLLSATIDFSLHTHCALCNNSLILPRSIELSYKLATKDTGDEDSDLISAINGELDLAEIFTDGIMLEMPMRFLCRDDCKGLCSKCGKDLNQGSCDCEHGEIDPRLLKLKELL